MKQTIGLFIFIMLAAQVALAAALTPQDIIGHKYENSIKFVYNRGIVEGYPDGTYKPDVILNRAELLKIVVGSRYDEFDYEDFGGQACFNDIAGNEWYAKYVCFAKSRGIIVGNPDNTFLPSNSVNHVEALKIMMLGMGINVQEASSGAWYMPYYEKAEDYYLILDELKNTYGSDFSRSQAAEVITRILSMDAQVVQPPIYSSGGGYEPGNVYIGYLQWANSVDLYLMADSGISTYTHQGQAIFFIQGSQVISFDPNGSFTNSYTAGSVTVQNGFTLGTSQILYVGTAYLANTNPITVLSAP
ncbi:S-layer homology domain-containing protein [Candidatus Peregrinibacteria bacterium]|nr:S-layer homology domain-containing protein [Candidatus Peregrinibacteria bacterium]